MPKFLSIAEHLLFTTMRIVTRDGSGETGVGTAFIYMMTFGDAHAEFLVTNKHVVAGAAEGDLFFTRRDSSGGPLLTDRYILTVTSFEDVWHGHPDPEVDVTVALLRPLIEHVVQNGVDPYWRSIGDNIAPTEAMLDDLDAIEECVFVGYPNDIWDSHHNLPVVRRGLTATHPAIDFRSQPVFLLDASVFPGSSGSPVLVYNRGAFPVAKGGDVTIGTRVVFLGLIASVFFREHQGRLEAAPIPTSAHSIPISQEMIDLGVVFKARTILETVRHHFPRLFEPQVGS